jgi:hypothetical protein
LVIGVGTPSSVNVNGKNRIAKMQKNKLKEK